MSENRYKFFRFEEPIKCLMIATDSEEASLEYQEEVADVQDGCVFEEISQHDCLDTLSRQTTEDMPTIEYGYRKAAVDIQESLFCLAETGKRAIVLNVEQTHADQKLALTMQVLSSNRMQ